MAETVKSVVVKYSNKALDRALASARKLKKTLTEALAVEETVSNRAGLRAAERQTGLLQGERLRQQGRGRLGGGIRGVLAGRGPGTFEELRRNLLSGNFSALQSPASKVLSTISFARTQSLSAGINLAASFIGGPAGLVAQAVTTTMELVRPLIEKDIERVRQIIIADTRQMLDERLRETAIEPGAMTERQQRIRRQLAKDVKRLIDRGGLGGPDSAFRARTPGWAPMSERLAGL